ncbi:hypothetical protein CJD36_007295 [Flavipsychrobacter stenotrophus]|uniref:Type IX secretion system protein PorQ n=2 Tax=Flavipsychrobacter stenotrophus TaxID=2077091 RepID=A0A2S7SXD9_9BACT|nr:hypothetical protein CJD36_007295 [Flavipsychrobacter stenotrophus]
MKTRFRTMRGMKYALLFAGLLSCGLATAQVVGGQSSFEYLNLSNSPHVSALGGISVANPENDISLALQNPAMMRPGLHNQLGLNYNSFYGDIKVMNLQYGYYAPKTQTSFFGGVQYLNYGAFSNTDDLGNVYGDFHAVDYSITLGASRSYLQHWRYGAAVKYASSALYDAKASAVLMDVGINYYDTASLVDFGIVAKNMGGTIKKYNPNNPAEPLPFDLQLGISKRFKHLPLRVYTTLHHLYEWDVQYNNPSDNVGTGLLGSNDTASSKGSFGEKLFRHFIFGAELSLGKRLMVTVSYNDLRRREMVIKTKTGSAGFAFGVALNLNKFQVHYGRSYYHIAGAYNEIGINFALNKLMGLGKTGEKIKWNAEYPDWE